MFCNPVRRCKAVFCAIVQHTGPDALDSSDCELHVAVSDALRFGWAGLLTVFSMSDRHSLILYMVI